MNFRKQSIRERALLKLSSLDSKECNCPDQTLNFRVWSGQARRGWPEWRRNGSHCNCIWAPQLGTLGGCWGMPRICSYSEIWFFSNISTSRGTRITYMLTSDIVVLQFPSFSMLHHGSDHNSWYSTVYSLHPSTKSCPDEQKLTRERHTHRSVTDQQNWSNSPSAMLSRVAKQTQTRPQKGTFALELFSTSGLLSITTCDKSASLTEGNKINAFASLPCC